MVAESTLSSSFSEPPRSNHLHDLRDVDALEILVVDLADGGADQLARHRVAALEFAFVFQFQLAGDGGQRGVDIQ